MKFTNIPNELRYPSTLQYKIATIHSDIISWVVDNYEGTFQQRKAIIDVMNSVSYMLMAGDTLPSDWSPTNPLVNSPKIDDDTCRKYLGSVYIIEMKVLWDVDIKDTFSDISAIRSSSQIKPDTNIQSRVDKSDLYIQSPSVPRFDKNDIWLSGKIDDDEFVIYTSLPIVPTKQNEISVTTDISKMTHTDMVKLFPDQFVRTRPECMYERVEGITYHERYGLIIPIEGFTEEEVLHNIIEYPHLYKLTKDVDGEHANFYRTVEISGELHDVSDIWYSLPESSVIPFSPDFIKEYVTRRYLLERDNRNIRHRYKLVANMKTFLTLFMPPEMYEEEGYDRYDIAEKCVSARISYKKSMNPILRRLNDA